MSQYDLPAAFLYINNVTGELINYVGHSQGTVIMFAALARRDPTILKYLKHYCALGPVAYVNHATSPALHWANVTHLGNFILRDYKKFGFVDNTQRKAFETICEYDDAFCIETIKEIADANTTVDNMKRLDVFVGHAPAGTSV